MTIELLNKIHNAMIDYGAIRSNWRIKKTYVEIKYGSDWAQVGIEVYKPRCRKPVVIWNLVIYIPKNQIYWDKSTFIICNQPK